MAKNYKSIIVLDTILTDIANSKPFADNSRMFWGNKN